jgi:hypothetical protein
VNLYLVKSKEDLSWDTYDSFVVVANSEKEARNYHPAGKPYSEVKDTPDNCWADSGFPSWVNHPDETTAELIGKALPGAKPGDVIINSFNAG